MNLQEVLISSNFLHRDPRVDQEAAENMLERERNGMTLEWTILKNEDLGLNWAAM